MLDLRQLTFSVEIKEIVSSLREKFYFSDDSTVIKFGFAYAMKFCRDQISTEVDNDPLQASRGLSYSVSTFSESEISGIIEILYPECTTPFRFFRTASCYGLKKIQEKISVNPNIKLSDLM